MKQRGRNKVALLQKHTAALLCGPNTPGITINMKDIKLANPIVNGLSQSRLSVKSKAFATALTNNANNNDDNTSTLRSSDNGSEQYEQCSAYEKTYKLFSDENLTYEPIGKKIDRFSTCSGTSNSVDFILYYTILSLR